MLLAVPGLKASSNFEDSLSAIAILFDRSALDFGKRPLICLSERSVVFVKVSFH